MPVLFVGHGSPMNALERNRFTETLTGLSQRLPRPKAVCVVSAHWVTRGSEVLAVAKPRTIEADMKKGEMTFKRGKAQAA